VLEQLHINRKTKVATLLEDFNLTVERGKKKIKRVPIWRSPLVLDEFERRFGERPPNKQRATWKALAKRRDLSDEAREFAQAIVALSEGSNDAHWLGKVSEGEEGIDFSKVDADGFIHPSYRIYGSPDRPIASDPNIQNFPRVADDPRPVPLRAAVIPPREDMLLCSADYSAVETITQAIEAGDWDRVRDAQDGKLSHESTAKLINDSFRLSFTRQNGKTFNHAYDKGMTPYQAAALAFKVERPTFEQQRLCGKILNTMLLQYPKSSQFRDELWERARTNPLIVQNKFGRRLQCFSRSKYGDAGERNSKHDADKRYWCSCRECVPRRERWKFALAFLGRSSAVDALLRVLVRCWRERRFGDYSLPLIECHDEGVYAFPLDIAPKLAIDLRNAMEEPVEELGGIQLKAEVKLGRSWAETK